MSAAEFILPGYVPASDVAAFLSDEFATASAPAFSTTLRWHDTFDWRLFHSGWTIEEQVRGRTSTVHCCNGQSGTLLNVGLNGRLKQLSDLGAPAMERELQRALGLRALLVRTQLPVRVHELNLLNEDQKTVVRCRVEQFKPGDGADADAFTAVRLRGLRGYEAELRRARAQIAAATGIADEAGATLHKAMALTGETVGAYTAKPHVTLPPSASALEWLRAICRQLLDVMQRNEFGIVQDIDTEFLHDFRVAVRRTRSALGQIRDVFTPASLEPFKTEFAWLGQITGPVRDLDVFLLHFDELRASVPPELRSGLDGFHDYLHEQHARERRRLLRHLRGARYRELVDTWRSFLEAPPIEAQADAAHEPVVPVAERHTQRVWRRVRKQGRRIDASSPPEALHELRKSCKKLRYLLEFFAPLQAPDDSEHLIKRLKRLQDNLGDFQDRSVQIAGLRAIAEKLPQPDTLLAIGALMQRAADRGAAARRDFQAQFERFDTRSTARLFEHLFAAAQARLR